MELSTAKKFFNAIQSAGIKKYQLDTDLGSHYYNNENSVLVLDESESAVVNIKKRFTLDGDPYDGKLLLYISNLADIHEARVGGTYETIQKFIDAYGLSLTYEQLKIIVNIDKTNYNIMPESGDYLNFKYKSEEEIEKMEPEEKEAYEKEVAEYEKSLKNKGLTQGAAAQITI